MNVVGTEMTQEIVRSPLATSQSAAASMNERRKSHKKKQGKEPVQEIKIADIVFSYKN